MKKFTALILALLVLTGCASTPTPAPGPQRDAASKIEPAVMVAAPAHTDMLNELRPLLTVLVADDAALVREGFEACANLLFRDKDSYREAVLAQHADMSLALDHLTVAAAAKQHLCP